MLAAMRKSLLRTVPIACGLVALNVWMLGNAVQHTLPVRTPAPAKDAATIPRCVVLVVDGLDHGIVSAYLDEGRLPALRSLRDQGSFHPLQSELPPESPVALTSMQTGVNPGRHSVFDFVARDEQYRPQNGMVDVTPPRLLGRVPVRPPRVVSRVKAPTFTDVVWQAGYPILALRKPLGFPVRHQPGAFVTSGLGTPDVAGSAGLYLAYSSKFGFQAGETVFGGKRVPIRADANAPHRFETWLEGPPDPTLPRDDRGGRSYARVPVVFERLPDRNAVRITVQGTTHVVAKRSEDIVRSPFFAVDFALGTIPSRRVAGVVRFSVRSLDPLEVFTDPVNFDPRDPPFPISSPPAYAGDLWRRHGPYETVGWPEQTFQRNDRWQTNRGFLDDLLEDVDRAGGNLLGELRRRPQTRLVFTTITATDRACHCFFWTRDPQHPFYDKAEAAKIGDPIGEVFERVDALIGRVREALDPRDTLIVASDHGFTTWRWSMHINQWLVEEGYLVLHTKAARKDLRGFFGQAAVHDVVDWDRTRAYAMGLGQIYLNVRGRDARGVVAPGDVAALCEEIREKLLALENPFVDATHEDTPRRPVRKVWFLRDEYTGPHADRAPDLQIGFDRGYRVSWQTALLGGMGPGQAVFERNKVPWSGDHCSCDPAIVPGVLFTNRPCPADPDRAFHVRDIAATVYEHFGLDASHLDGRALPLLGSP